MERSQLLASPLTLVVVSLLVSCMVTIQTKAAAKPENGGQGEVIGYGYKVKYAKIDNSTGRSLVALLQLIRNSSVYGPDIQLLSLTVRYFDVLNYIFVTFGYRISLRFFFRNIFLTSKHL